MSWYISFHMRIRVLGGILGMRILLFSAFAFAFTNWEAVFVAFSIKDFGYPLQSAR